MQIMQIGEKDEIAFVLEPRLNEVVLLDYLAHDTPVKELTFRVESERLKAKRRCVSVYVCMHVNMYACFPCCQMKPVCANKT